MNRIFGKKVKQAPVEPVKRVDISESLTKSDNRINDIQAKYDACTQDLIKLKQQLANTRGPSAQRNLKLRIRQVLQRRKMLDNQLSSAYNTASNLQQSSFAIENAQMMYDSVEAQKSALESLKEQNKKFNIDDIEDMHDDMADILADAEDVNDLMSRNFGVTDDIDDAELDAELGALDDEIAAEGFDEDLGFLSSDANTEEYLSAPVATSNASGRSRESTAATTLPSAPVTEATQPSAVPNVS